MLGGFNGNGEVVLVASHATRSQANRQNIGDYKR